MTSTVSPSSSRSGPPYAVAHAAQWRRLQEERLFRVDQLADLDEEVPATARLESVQQVLRASAAAALAEIESALDRLEQGTYGLCVTCGEPLDAQRLSILPMASLCMRCHYNEQNCHVAAFSWQEA
jgi:DnaK suppressor protein